MTKTADPLLPLDAEFSLETFRCYGIAKVFILRFLTHAEYSKGNWKTEL
jgi:hypothetical protein